jgi:hypothetical protein
MGIWGITTNVVAYGEIGNMAEITNEQIKDFIIQNSGNNDIIAKAMYEYGVTPTRVASIMGWKSNDVDKIYRETINRLGLNNTSPVNTQPQTATPSVVPVSSPTIIDQGVAQPNAPTNTQPPRVNPSVATTTAQNVLGGGVPQQPQIPQYARQPWMNNSIPPQYQQMTMQQPPRSSQTPPWVQQMQSWGRQQPQQQPPMPPQYQQPQMCQAPQQLRYTQPTYGRY